MTPTRPVMRYHGGKWRLAPWIIGHFPEHAMYVEPFGGGASVLLRKTPALQEIYNDLDSEIVNVFRVLRDEAMAVRLIRQLELTPHAREEYELSWKPPADCPVETARRTLVRAYMGYGGNAVTAQYKTGFRNRRSIGDTGLAGNWSKYPASIAVFVERLRQVTVECLPALELIPKYDGPGALFYVDPPYLPETRTPHGQGYRHEMTPEQHMDLARTLQGVQGMVVLSGYDSPLYRELYAGWRMVTRAARGEKAAARTECLWISPKAAVAMPQRSILEVV